MKKHLSQKSFKEALVRFWPIMILLILGVVIAVVNLSPAFSIIGWDNFSVSLNLDVNFFRTLFATWRQYRGLGVASDSEVVDIFRQIILRVLSIIVPTVMLDGVYYCLMLMLGAVSTYLLVKEVLSTVNTRLHEEAIKVSAFLAALYYVFNLQTFEVFYLPIVMYVTRYGFFPLILYLFLKILNQKQWKLSTVVLFVVAVFFGSVSYLTATVFFTLLLLLLLISLSYLDKLPKLLALLGFFVLLNCFWLLPFGNYYQQKASLIPTASSFIEVNESLLNKPATSFAWEKILIFFPEILDSKALPFKQLETGQAVVIHPLVNALSQPITLFLLFLPLVIILIGALALIFSFKNKVKGLWVILLALGMLFLLRKEQWPLGFLSDWLNVQIPLFKIVFRFGSAKFSPLLLIANSILFGFGLAFLIRQLTKHTHKLLKPELVKVGLILGMFVLLMLPFRSVFRGELFSSIVENKVPEAYTQVADTVAADPNQGRVLHLPFDEFSYWKSYSWGYVGSSFFSFMVPNPVLDRTFEPASPELDNLLAAFQNLSLNFSTKSLAEKRQLATQATYLLQQTQTKYVLFDESVRPELYSRELLGWQVFHRQDYQALVDQMAELGFISLKTTTPIQVTAQPNLLVYEVQTPSPMVASLATATNIDPEIENAFIEPLVNANTPFIQTAAYPFRTYPFWQPKAVLQTGLQTNLTLPFVHGDKVVANLAIPSEQALKNQRKLPYAVYLNRSENQLVVTFAQASLPVKLAVPTMDIQEVQLALPEAFLSDQESIDLSMVAEAQPLAGDVRANYRVLVNGMMVPIPVTLSSDPEYQSTMLLDNQPAQVSLVAVSHKSSIPAQDFDLTADPNCYEDKKADYAYSFDNTLDSVKLKTSNGMTCVTVPLYGAPNQTESSKNYFETEFTFEGSSFPITNTSNRSVTSHPEIELRRAIDALPSYSNISACVINVQTGECLNPEENLTLGSAHRVIVPIGTASAQPQSQLLISLPAEQNQQSEMTLTDAAYRVFQPIAEATVQLQPWDSPKVEIGLQAEDTLTLSWNSFMSSDSYYSNPLIAMNTYPGPCTETNTYRKVATTQNFPILSYVENCFQGVFTSLPLPQHAFQLWSSTYSVFKGKQPRFILSGQNQLFNQFLSRYDLYPNIPKLLQVADQGWWVSSQGYQNQINSSLATDKVQTAYVTVSDPYLAGQTGPAQYEINQQTEGQSLLGLKNSNVQELPIEWQNLTIDNGIVNQAFDQAQVTSVETILPSLWKITVKKPENTKNGQVLLSFGQAFDTQWRIFQTNSAVSAWLNMGQPPTNHVKVQGWSNGWILPTSLWDTQEEVTFYIFYTPERLALLGWIITITTVVAGVIVVNIYKRKGHISWQKFGSPL